MTWEADAGQRRDERDGGRPAADDDDLLSADVEAFGPGLGMHDGARKVGHAVEVGQVAVVVAVVPAAAEEEGGGEFEGLVGVRPLGGDAPERIGRRPAGRSDPVVEANVGIDARFPGGVLDVLEYGVAIGDRLLAVPGPERIAQRVHVRVGSDAGIAEEVPRPPDGVSGLEDRVVGPGTLGLEVVAGTDAGQSGAHDEDVEVGRRSGQTSSPSSCCSDQLVVQGAVLPGAVALQDSTNSDVWRPIGGGSDGSGSVGSCAGRRRPRSRGESVPIGL